MKRGKRKKPEGNRKERSRLFRWKYHAEDLGLKWKKKIKPETLRIKFRAASAKAGRCHGGWFWAGTRLRGAGKQAKLSQGSTQNQKIIN